MTGVITPDIEALLRVRLRGPAGLEQVVDAVLDTGFNGYLTLPDNVVSALGLGYHSQTMAMLADGSLTPLRKFEGTVEWDGVPRDIIVLEASGGALVGMSMLHGSRVMLDVVDGGPVTIAPLP